MGDKTDIWDYASRMQQKMGAGLVKGCVVLADTLWSWCRKPLNPDGDWWELWDEKLRLPYYYHSKKGSTQWEKPSLTEENFISLAQVQVSAEFLREGWVEKEEEEMEGAAREERDDASREKKGQVLLC